MKQELKMSRGVVLAVSMIAFSLGQTFFCRSALESLHLRSGKIITKMMEPLLEHAHRLNDDLTLQVAVQGLSQGPGVLFAGVLDNDRKIIAHTDPSLLGQPFDAHIKRTPYQSLWIHPLQETSLPWGTLIFSLSKHTLRQKIAEQVFLLLAGDTAIVLSVLWLWLQWKQTHKKNLDQIEDLNHRHTDLNEQFAQLQQKHRDLEVVSIAQIQSAVEQIAQGVLLLDQTQRVLAWNKPAITQLRIGSDANFRGKSWQDVAYLDQHGDALQRSLETPGRTIEVLSKDSSTKISYFSQIAPDNAGSTTWVFFS